MKNNNNKKLKKHLDFVNPFKSNDFTNPCKTIEDSMKRVKRKANKIK